MADNPSTLWYWNDWDNDRGLQLCSLAAQGLWMRMLSLAARSGGYVTVGGKRVTASDLAVLTGNATDTIETLLAELHDRGVFGVTKGRVIFNRRMIRDERRRETNRENGRKGGIASLEKQRGIFNSPKRQNERAPERRAERTAERLPERPSEPPLPSTLYPKNPIPLSPSPKRAGRAARLTDDFTVSELWLRDAQHARQRHSLAPIDLRLEAEKFTTYWQAKAGNAATKLDWHKTWINWSLNAKPPTNGNGKSRADSVIEAFAFAAGIDGSRDSRRDSPPLPPLLPG